MVVRPCWRVPKPKAFHSWPSAVHPLPWVLQGVVGASTVCKRQKRCLATKPCTLLRHRDKGLLASQSLLASPPNCRCPGGQAQVPGKQCGGLLQPPLPFLLPACPSAFVCPGPTSLTLWAPQPEPAPDQQKSTTTLSREFPHGSRHQCRRHDQVDWYA